MLTDKEREAVADIVVLHEMGAVMGDATLTSELLDDLECDAERADGARSESGEGAQT